MRNKGFTLIELLAVIIILSIVALIATPIILGIINDTKKEASKRSVEMYAKALQNSIVKYQLSGKELGVSKLETTDGRNFSNIPDFKVEYEGNVVCDVIEVYEDGNFYLTNCKVNGQQVEYTYGKSNIPEPVSFAEDSWETIAANVKAGNLSKYKVGDTKEVSLQPTFINQETDSNGLYTVRIANISSDDTVCKNDNYSKTACGFVVEFVDVIAEHNVNPTETNVGGYPASTMYTYIKNDIYNSLPNNLKDVIIDTKIVSSHGSTSVETNFVSIDKLYLLSTKEVWGKEGTSNVINYDTAEEETRQLDYYKSIGVTTSSYSGAIKEYNGSANWWWLRSATSFSTNPFYGVHIKGGGSHDFANCTHGVAVAFRIG